ncbi:MAG TPA: GNAT family N-acetyltransferase [Actinopolymorphaceae bacterium]
MTLGSSKRSRTSGQGKTSGNGGKASKGSAASMGGHERKGRIGRKIGEKGTVEIRPASDADRRAVEVLCVASLEFDSRRDARAFPTVLLRRPVIHLVAVEGDEIVGTAFGSTKDKDGTLVGYVDLIAVAPGMRRQGIGSSLLAALEARLQGVGCQEVLAAGNPPWYAWPGVDVRYTPAICLFEKFGFERVGEAHNMTVELRGQGEMLDTTADEERLAEAGVTVRRLESYDREAITPWLRSWGGTWAQEALGALRHDPVRCHVAVGADGEWLGFAAWGVNAPTVFGPMGTRESARRSGIGAVLLRRCLADQYVEEIDMAEIGWAGPYRFYSRAVGARISRVFWLLRKPLSS